MKYGQGLSTKFKKNRKGRAVIVLFIMDLDEFESLEAVDPDSIVLEVGSTPSLKLINQGKGTNKWLLTELSVYL